MVNPVLLGSGSSVVAGMGAQFRLELRGVDQFESGNVLLTYAVPG